MSMYLSFRRGAVVVLLVALAAMAVSVVGASAAGEHVAKVPGTCNGLQYGHMGPLTGASAVLGQEQLDWDLLALAQFNAAHHTNFKVVQGDDQLNAAQGSTVAQSFASNPRILGVVGPAGTQVVKVAAPIFDKVHLAMVSESATDASLSNGSNPTFFRVNANNASQAPLLYLLIQRKLKAKKVMVIDDQSPDKTELANEVARKLQAKGIEVDRESVSQAANDFSSLIGRIDSQTSVVLLSWQTASQGQLFGQQMAAQGKHATLVGANGLYSPTQFTPEGGYVASFAPDVRFNKNAQSTVKAYVKRYGNNFGTYGPPTYVAAQVVMTAMWNVCSKGQRPTRSSVLAAIRKTHLPQTILGTPVSFAKNGNSRSAVFFLFQIKNGKYVPATTK
jgi:branched-chain amino acid transport system substrate-binding protein